MFSKKDFPHKMEQRWTTNNAGTSPALAPSSHHHLDPLKDLVIFEERIRQNVQNYQRIKKSLRLRTILLSLALVLLIFLHARFVNIVVIFTAPSFLTILGFLLLYAALGVALIMLVLSIRGWRASQVHRYEDQCTKVLKYFGLQLSFGNKEKELCFAKRLPRRLAELLDAYRQEYRARRALRSNLGTQKTT